MTIAWDDLPDEIGYKVYKWGYDGADWDFILYDYVAQNWTSYEDWPIECGTDYYYQISAYNSNGESSPTGWVLGITDDCPVINPDSYEPDNTALEASSISSGSSQTHTIAPAGDSDWMKFILNTEAEITLETTGADGDTEMWLKDPYLNTIEYNDDGGSDYFSYIDRVCGVDSLSPGTYYVKIEEYGDDDPIAAYDLHFDIVRTCSSAREGSNTGLYDPVTSLWSLKNDNKVGGPNLEFSFGPGGAGWLPLTGDWNNDEVDTIGLYNPSTSKWYLRNTNASGPANAVFRFGPVGMGWIPITGNWDNDGIVTVGFYSPITSKFYLRNSHAAGAADVVFRFGPAGMGWLPYVGDWDNDGVDEVGLYNPITSKFYLRNSHTAGAADVTFRFGVVNAGWLPVAGDWDDDGFDTVGLYKPANSKWYLRNTTTDGVADVVFQFGPPASTWTPLAGAWD